MSTTDTMPHSKSHGPSSPAVLFHHKFRVKQPMLTYHVNITLARVLVPSQAVHIVQAIRDAANAAGEAVYHHQRGGVCRRPGAWLWECFLSSCSISAALTAQLANGRSLLGTTRGAGSVWARVGAAAVV